MRLQLNNPSFLDPMYELVALIPENFLPAKKVLLRYDPEQGSPRIYVPSPDHRLRESPGNLTCPQFPPFSGPTRQPDTHLNPFLVILSGESLFRTYFDFPSPPPLPNDVLELMKATIELVDLIYWKSGKTRMQKAGIVQKKEALALAARIKKGYDLLFGEGGLSASLLCFFFLH